MKLKGIKCEMKNMNVMVIEGDPDILDECVLITKDFESIPCKVEFGQLILPFAIEPALEQKEFIIIDKADINQVLGDVDENNVSLDII